MKGRLLIVDDEIEIREMLSRNFRMLNYEVITSVNGREALEKLSQTKFDIVISDIRMPEMDGVELLRAIRSQYPMIRVIIITGYVTLENALMCMRNQADTFIFKPLADLTELEKAVDTAMEALEQWHRKLRILQGMKPSEI